MKVFKIDQRSPSNSQKKLKKKKTRTKMNLQIVLNLYQNKFHEFQIEIKKQKEFNPRKSV